MVGIVLHGDQLGLALGVVGDGELHGLQNCHDPLSGFVQILPQAELQESIGNGVGGLGYAYPLAEVADGSGSIAPAAQAAERGHPGIIPAGDIAVLHKGAELPLAQHGVVDAKAGKLDLTGMVRDGNVLYDPVIQGPMILKFQGAQGMGDPLQGILDGMGKVVHGVNAPLVPLAVMVHMPDPVDDWVAHIEVAGGQVNLGPEGIAVVLKFAVPHPTEKIQALFNRTVPVGGDGGSIQISPVLLELLGSQLADIGQSLLNQLHRVLVVLLKIVGAVEEAVAPIEAQPVDVLLDGLHKLHVLFRGVGVVHPEIAQTTILLRCAKIDDQSLAVADVKVTVGFRGEPGMHRLTGIAAALGDVLVDKRVDEILALGDFSH